jgi:hypothetical protein
MRSCGTCQRYQAKKNLRIEAQLFGRVCRSINHRTTRSKQLIRTKANQQACWDAKPPVQGSARIEGLLDEIGLDGLMPGLLAHISRADIGIGLGGLGSWCRPPQLLRGGVADTMIQAHRPLSANLKATAVRNASPGHARSICYDSRPLTLWKTSAWRCMRFSVKTMRPG